MLIGKIRNRIQRNTNKNFHSKRKYFVVEKNSIMKVEDKKSKLGKVFSSFFLSSLTWICFYILPAVATGLFFASAVGRYTTETQFSQNAFQNYLRPYQLQYRGCLVAMDTLRERWENLEAVIKFATSKESDDTPAVLIKSNEGFIGNSDDDNAESLLGRIVAASRKAASCQDETIRQAEELAALIGYKDWFSKEIEQRSIKMDQFKYFIDENWLSIRSIKNTWEITDLSIKSVNGETKLKSKTKENAIRYIVAIERFRSHLLEAHARNKIWFDELNYLFVQELTARSSRTVGFYLKRVLFDLSLDDSIPANRSLSDPKPSRVWVEKVESNPLPADCSCSRPFAGGPLQRLGDPP